jgi:hypothetical protein
MLPLSQSRKHGHPGRPTEIYLGNNPPQGEECPQKMSAHQGGKACLLSNFDAELLENHGVVPRCIDHRHMRKAAAEEMANKRELRRIRVPGPDRFVEVRPQHWKAVRGVMQLVDGDIPGRMGRLRYSIEAAGAHERRQNVRAINTELSGEGNESSGTT